MILIILRDFVFTLSVLAMESAFILGLTLMSLLNILPVKALFLGWYCHQRSYNELQWERCLKDLLVHPRSSFPLLKGSFSYSSSSLLPLYLAALKWRRSSTSSMQQCLFYMWTVSIQSHFRTWTSLTASLRSIKIIFGGSLACHCSHL